MTENKTCPECGAETVVSHWYAEDCNAGLDTSVEHCPECEWEGDPE